jgi:hypothetical protein
MQQLSYSLSLQLRISNSAAQLLPSRRPRVARVRPARSHVVLRKKPKKKYDYLTTFRNAHVALVGATPTQCLQCISTVFVLFPDHWCIARGDLTCVINVTSSRGLLRALRELEGLPWNAGSEQ